MDESKIQFSTTFNYQKIATEGSETIAVAAGVPYVAIKTVVHSLGEIPSARVWYDPALGKRFPVSVEQYVDDTTFVSEVNLVTTRAYLTTTTLVIECSNSSGSSKNVVLYWKIYYDS